MNNPPNSQQLTNNSQAALDRFLVCGLGSLGQHCVAALKEFGVSVSAITEEMPKKWEILNIPQLLDELIIGDCRQTSVLEKAGIDRCRAVLLVINNESQNAETALAVRQLNSQTRLVVRSAKTNLNQLLSEHLGNFVAFDPTQLPTTAFALAALGSETAGFFNLDGHWLRAVNHQLSLNDRWCNQQLYEFSRNHRILSYIPNSAQPFQSFYDWEPEATLQSGDTIVYIETTDKFLLNQFQKSAADSKKKKRHLWQEIVRRLTWKNLKNELIKFLQASAQQQILRVAIVCAITVLFLLLCGTLLFDWYYPEMNFVSAFYAVSILLLGGYADLFGNLQNPPPIPGWLQLFSLGLTLAGTAFVGVLYALLTQVLLSAKFQFAKRRPPVPEQDHVVLIGLGRVGRRVAALLQEFKQPLVGVTTTSDFDMTILPEMPLIISGNFTEALPKANFSTAKSIIVGTEDEMLNLEIGLMARAINPNNHLVIRTFEQRLSDNLAQLLPNAQVLCAYAVAAEAFAGAAFGEKIISLFRLNKQTILVTEYNIEANDSLNGLLLSEVAYGYGVVPILHQKERDNSKLMPSEDTLLNEGDRLVVLATINGLRHIERGKLFITPKRWRLQVEKALNQEAVFEGANTIARISGCELSAARELMNNLPGTLRMPLYKHQAQRLVQALSKTQVSALAVPMSSKNSNTKNSSSP